MYVLYVAINIYYIYTVLLEMDEINCQVYICIVIIVPFALKERKKFGSHYLHWSSEYVCVGVSTE